MLTAKQKEEIIKTATSHLGVAYDRGATAEQSEQKIDCSLLSQIAYKSAGIEIERSSILQAADKNAKEIEITENYENLELGDLIFFRSDRGFYYDELFDFRKIYIGHVGIYIGNGEIIHARKAKGGVLIEKLENLKNEDPSSYSITMIKRY